MGLEVQAMVRDETFKHTMMQLTQNKAIKATGDNAGLVLTNAGCPDGSCPSLCINK